MAAKPLKWKCYISVGNQPPVEMETLTQEQKERATKARSERLSLTMSSYYSQHRDEFLNLKEGEQA